MKSAPRLHPLQLLPRSGEQSRSIIRFRRSARKCLYFVIERRRRFIGSARLAEPLQSASLVFDSTKRKTRPAKPQLGGRTPGWQSSGHDKTHMAFGRSMFLSRCLDFDLDIAAEFGGGAKKAFQ